METDPKGSRRRLKPAEIRVPAGSVRVFESHHAPGFEMEMSAWPFHKICWVAMGRGSLEGTERAIPIQRDDFLLLPAGWSHRFVDDSREPLTLCVLCLSESFLDSTDRGELARLWQTPLEREAIGVPLCARSGFHRSSLIGQFRAAMRESGSKPAGWQTALAATASTVLVYLNRQYCRPRKAPVDASRQSVEGSIEYIDSHLQDALQIDEMARSCRLSPRRYTAIFKEVTGRTFSQYLRRKRIEYACRRLDETGHILYACNESGFNDVAYFYRVFKKEMGQTPGEYLKRDAE